MKNYRKLAAAAILSAAGFALSATSAAAYVVCNHEGECWHSHYRDYHPEFGIAIHPDSWRWHHSDHYRWHEVPHDHGYWRNGVWVEF